MIMFNPSFSICLCLLLLLTPICGFGADDPIIGANFGKAPAAIATKSASHSATKQNSAAFSTVLTRDITINAKDSTMLEVPADLSGAEKVAISITTLDDPASRLTSVRIGVAFAIPDSWYILTDTIRCSTFNYFDHGGATVPVYGPYMKIGIFNDGATPLKVTQVSVYAVTQ